MKKGKRKEINAQIKTKITKTINLPVPDNRKE
jgi:hypothetical protein